MVAAARAALEYERVTERLSMGAGYSSGPSALYHMASNPDPAIVARVPLLLMDEPFSGLDSLNGRLLLAALVSIAHGRPPPVTAEGGTGGAAAGAAAGGAAGAMVSAAAAEWPGGARMAVGACVLLSVHQPTERFLRSMSGTLVMAPAGRIVFAGPLTLADGSCALAAAFDPSRAEAPRLRDLSPNAAEAVLEVVCASVDDAAAEQRIRNLYEGAQAAAAAAAAAARWNWVELSEPSGATHAGFGAQLLALGRRHSLVLLRHPVLVLTNLGSGVCVGLVCAWAFWHVDLELSGGVLQRMGVLFFLGVGSAAILPRSRREVHTISSESLFTRCPLIFSVISLSIRRRALPADRARLH